MPITKASPIFPKSEYFRRLAAVKLEMSSRGVEAFVVRSPASITYLTGYTALSGYVAQALVVSINKDEPTFILRLMDAPAAIHQTFLERSNIIGYPEYLVGNPDLDGFDTIIDFLFEAGLTNHGLGLELGSCSLQTFEKFKKRLPAARFVDFSGVIDWIRMLKSDLEISIMREAAAIADAGILRAAEVIRPGVREADAVAEIAATLVRGVNGKPGTSLREICLNASPRTGTCHIAWTEDAFREGSQINLEIAGVRHGYTAALMRTFIIGRPSSRLLRFHEAETAGLQAALDAVRPGATCGDIARAFNQTLAKHGLKKDSRCGYPIGIDWIEDTASLSDGDTTELKPNMTFHLMLGNWVDEDFGYVISETFRVTETGSEVLTRAPRQLFEL